MYFKLLANPGQSPSAEPTPPKGGKSIKGTYLHMYVRNSGIYNISKCWLIACSHLINVRLSL